MNCFVIYTHKGMKGGENEKEKGSKCNRAQRRDSRMGDFEERDQGFRGDTIEGEATWWETTEGRHHTVEIER
jgi:hypothetical protein